MRYKYTDKEIDAILKTMVIVIDTREKANEHIRDYLHKKGVPFKIQKLETGDYSAMLPANEELGIKRDIYLNSFVERKAHLDEITGNLQRDTQTAFENELRRSQDSRFVLIVEDIDFYTKLLKGQYRSKYDPKALLGRLKSFQVKYDFDIIPVKPLESGNFIYYRFYYEMRHHLKNGVF